MNNYISIKQVLDDLLAHPLLQDLTLERAVNYALHFIRIVGCPQIFTEKEATLQLKNYRCQLPCDLVDIIQVIDDQGHSYRYASDTFHFTRNSKERADLTYKIQNSFLYSNKETGTIKISYRAIETDADGFPVIPDNSSFIKALELYIKKEQFSILFDQDKIKQNSLQNVQQEYAWYVGQAQSDLVRPSIDQLESITNMWNQLLIKTNEHNKQFVNTGTKEYIKTH